MSANEGIETYFERGEWKNFDEATRDDVGSVHTSRDDAVAEGRQLARDRNVEHVVRDEDATIVDRDDADEQAPNLEVRRLEEQAFESRHGTADPVDGA